MAHEILSVKLCQLDDRLGKLHSRIHMSETANHGRLLQEIAALKQECAETDEALRENLSRSKAPLAAVLAQNYGQITRMIQQTGEQIQERALEWPNAESAAEEKILLAEYALDFAQRAAERALLLSLEAIDAQLLWQQEERKLS